MRTYSRLLAPHSLVLKPQVSRIPEFLSRRISRLPLRLLPVWVAIAVSGCNWSALVSQNSAGEEGNGWSQDASISADGRYIAFSSGANNLVVNDTNGKADVFVRDTLLGVTAMVSVNSAGEQSYNSSGSPAISADGRYVVFASEGTNLVPGDTNNVGDFFLHDRDTGVTTRVSVDSEGNQGTGICRGAPALSADGRYIAFSCVTSHFVGDYTIQADDVFVHDRVTTSTTLVSVHSAGDALGGSQPDISVDGRFVAFVSINLTGQELYPDVYVNDRDTGVTTLVSVNSEGRSGYSYAPSISADGRYVAFRSSGYLLPGNLNSFSEVYVKDRDTGNLTRANVDSSGNPGNGASEYPDISTDGRYVAFHSSAENLVAGDTNLRDDVFVHDRVTGVTTRESVDAAGNEGYGNSTYPKISADGRYVVFLSEANSVSGGTNGEAHVVVKAFPHLTVTGVLPSKLPVGSTTSVTITGTNFLPGSTPKLDANVSNVVIVDEQTMTADVTVPMGKATGAYDVSVYLPGTGPGALAGSVANCADCVTFTSVPPGC